LASYLLAWNPNRWEWDIAEFVRAFNAGEVTTERWSCGNNSRIHSGDRVWLIRLGKEPRGIFACGTVIQGSYEDTHWSDQAKTARYVQFQIDGIINPETDTIIPRKRLDEPPFDTVHWSTQTSGITISNDVSLALHQEWIQIVDGEQFSLPEEIPHSFTFREGAQRIITVNSYERNSRARQACIDHHGAICSICRFDFAEKYGEMGHGYIHVHHLTPIAEVGDEYELDPIADLRPVCPNCHAMIHSRIPAYTIDDVKRAIGE
jgi:5-methylcytosine-specific restriction enzyme A